MKCVLVLITWFLGFVTLGFAQQTTDNHDPASKEQASRLVELMNLKGQMAGMSTGMKQAMLPNLIEEFKKQIPDAPPAAISELTAAYDEMFTEMFKSFSATEMESALVQIYQKHLTRAEADAAIAFYASPEGQSFLNKAPIMGTEAMQAIMPKLKAQTEQLGQKFQARMEEIKKKYAMSQ